MAETQAKRALKGQQANRSGANGPNHAKDTQLAHVMPSELVLPIDAIPKDVLPRLEEAFGDLSERMVGGNPSRNPVSGLPSFNGGGGGGTGDPSDSGGAGGTGSSSGNSTGTSGSSSGSISGEGQATEGNISDATSGAVGSTGPGVGAQGPAGVGDPGQDTGPQAGPAGLGEFADAVLSNPVTGVLGKALRGEEINDEDIALGFAGLIGTMAGFPVGPAMAIGRGLAALGGTTDPTSGLGGGQGIGGVGPAAGSDVGGGNEFLPTIEEALVPSQGRTTVGAEVTESVRNAATEGDSNDSESDSDDPFAELGFEFLDFDAIPEFVPLPSAHTAQANFQRNRGQS